MQVQEFGPVMSRFAFQRGGAPVLWTLSVYLADRVYRRLNLPGAARRLLDSERFEGVPVSSFQERLCTLWQGGKNI